VPGLQARDGLATINGSNLLTPMSAIHLSTTRALAEAGRDRLRDVARGAAREPQALRHAPARAARLRRRRAQRRGRSASCIEGSDLLTGKLKVKVQDAYSMRSTPQVIGAAHDAVALGAQPGRDRAERRRRQPDLPARGEPDAHRRELPGHARVAADGHGRRGVTMVSVLSERRLNRLLNPALSVGLPAFLTKGAGMFSGMMLSQYTADTLIVEQRILSRRPRSQSIPAAADQEDFVSMGMNTAIKNGQILENACGVLGIEMMAAAQAGGVYSFVAILRVQEKPDLHTRVVGILTALVTVT
jgi:histidine ammonia-lyase